MSKTTRSRRTIDRVWVYVPFLSALIISLVPVLALAQADTRTEIKLRAIADGVLENATFRFVDVDNNRHYSSPLDARSGARLRPESRYNDWRYWNGVLNIAMTRLGDALHDTEYVKFSDRNIAFCFNNYQYFKERYKGEGKWSYPFGQLFTMEELDDCGAMGASVIEAHRRDRQKRYESYIDLAANHIEKVQSRLSDGTLVRSSPRKWTIWADDLYMSISFLSRKGERTTDARYFDDAAQQVVNFHKYLYDEARGLLRHCWYSDTRRSGVAFWGRANGWAMLAQVDLLDRLPKTHPLRDSLLALLRRDIRGIVRYQGEHGLWHQLLEKTDSYEETSCSAMFTYAIARAVNKGYVGVEYASVARKGWEGVMAKIQSDGQIEGVCTGTGVGDDLEFYYKRPTPLNDEHGIGVLLLAGAEVMQLPN
jgi:unsaturated rhamnogalacturonyl hydrolase